MPTPPQSPASPADQLAEKMKEIEQKAKERMVAAAAEQTAVSYINLVGFPISPEAIALVPKEQAVALKAVCFLSTGDEVRLGAVNPADPAVKELLYQAQERGSATRGDIYAISEESLKKAIAVYDTLPAIKKIVKGVAVTEADLAKFKGGANTLKGLADQIKNVSVSEVVTLCIAAALEGNASDIHVETEEKEVMIRFRLDGILHDVARLPTAEWPKIASRIKLLAGLKINVTNKPQDGRFTIHLADDQIDVRVSLIPTAHGESVVMRLLRASGAGKQVSFADLGVRPVQQKILAAQIQRPNGMIITTGPTGSGKTTTLYGILKQLNTPDVKIITLEDPVEYKLEGINQSQIDTSRDYTFAKGLRAILRQDPDVVMVGEIRDLETAEIAIQAALTGHLVLSTIHTNSASGAIPRFLSMGVKPFLLAPALNLVIGQRLVRMICPDCKIKDELTPDLLKRAKEALAAIPKSSGENVPTTLAFWKGGGCTSCLSIGYKGRLGIYEMMVMDKDIEKVILSEEVSEYRMQEIATDKGMINMAQDGLLKALDGLTTVDEVFRVAE